jgi:hypothetical protein
MENPSPETWILRHIYTNTCHLGFRIWKKCLYRTKIINFGIKIGEFDAYFESICKKFMPKKRWRPKKYKVIKVENLHRILIFRSIFCLRLNCLKLFEFIFIKYQNMCSLAYILISKSFLISKNFEAVREWTIVEPSCTKFNMNIRYDYQLVNIVAP